MSSCSCRLNSRVARHLCCEIDRCCYDSIIKIQKQDGGFWVIRGFSLGGACPSIPALLAGSTLMLLRMASLLPLVPLILQCRRIPYCFPFGFERGTSWELSFWDYFTQARVLVRLERWGREVLPHFYMVIEHSLLPAIFGFCLWFTFDLANSLLSFVPWALSLASVFDAGSDIR